MRMFGSREVALAAALFAVSVLPSPAAAKTEIQGDIHAVTVRVENASIDETLKALEASFDLRFRAPGPLAKSISGFYQGSLKEVVKRLLNGYDFVLTTRGAAIEVAVTGKSAAPAATEAPSQNTASISRPIATAQTAKIAIHTQVAALETALEVSNTGHAIAGPLPQMMAQNDASIMPMPSKEGRSMPMPTPSASGTAAMPQPAASGATMPMPQPDTSGKAGVPMPPASPAQSASEPAQPPQPASMPKPN